MKANERQVGGDHYKKAGETGEEHWDRVWRLFGAGYFIGCITKYVERYQSKNGIQDLEKAAHFLQKLIELEEAKKDKPLPQELDLKPLTKEEIDAIVESATHHLIKTMDEVCCSAMGLDGMPERLPHNWRLIQQPTGTAQFCDRCGKMEAL